MKPIFRNVITVLCIAGIIFVLGLAAKYGNQLIEMILANGGFPFLITIFATALIVAIILGIVEIWVNSRKGKGQHKNNAD
jgi:uncharacterized membrane protein